MSLRTQREKERLSEIKRLITETVNPAPNEKDERINQCTHVAEDVLSELRKMKESEEKIDSGNMLEINSCGLPQETNDSIIDEKMSNILGKEISSENHDKVRKTTQERKLH